MNSTMNVKNLEENVKCSVLMFELPKEQHVLFIPYTEVKQMNNTINFSAIVNLAQNNYLNIELSLKLLKLNQDNSIMTFNLSNIDLKENGNEEYEDGKKQSFSTLPGDPFLHKRVYRYEFQNVPVPGSGRYALAVVYEEGDSIYPLDCFYFNVV